MNLKRLHQNQDGVALVMVLGVLSVCMLLIAHLLLVSEGIGREAIVVTRKNRLRYQAESAADTSYWMHLVDRRLFSNRVLGQSADDEMRASQNFPPWMLDRRPHNFDDGLVTVWLGSAEEGFKANDAETLRGDIDEGDELEISAFIDALGDYTDSDDLHKLNGMENEQYAAEGFPTLPRNAAMEFKGEIYWLPNWRAAIPGEIAVIPPPGLAYPTTGRNARPSFFSATESTLQNTLELTDDELEEIRRARQLWQEEGTPISESISTELWSQIQANFSLTENNLAQIYALASEQDRSIRTAFRIIREANLSRSSCYSDRKQETLAIWERFVE